MMFSPNRSEQAGQVAMEALEGRTLLHGGHGGLEGVDLAALRNWLENNAGKGVIKQFLRKQQVPQGLLKKYLVYQKKHEPTEQPTSPEQPQQPQLETYKAHLTGQEQVPAVETPATGEATFQLSKDGNSLSFKIELSGIQNVVGAHLHLGAKGYNGEIVANLFGPEIPGGGPFSGTLAEGTITSDSLTGSWAGSPLSALIDQIRAGRIYVSVKTNDGRDPTNTGPGDFPGGELRGYLVLAAATPTKPTPIPTKPTPTKPDDGGTVVDDTQKKTKKDKGKHLGKNKGKHAKFKKSYEWWEKWNKRREEQQKADYSTKDNTRDDTKDHTKDQTRDDSVDQDRR